MQPLQLGLQDFPIGGRCAIRGRGGNAVHIAGATLFWALAKPGHPVFAASADGQGEPKQVGTANTQNAQFGMFSSFGEYVSWDGAPHLIRYHVDSGAADELEVNYVGGPTLMLSESTVVTTTHTCRGFSIADFESGEVREIDFGGENLGGQTALAAHDGSVFCAGGDSVLRLDPASGDVELVRAAPGFFHTWMHSFEGDLLVQFHENILVFWGGLPALPPLAGESHAPADAGLRHCRSRRPSGPLTSPLRCSSRHAKTHSGPE